MWRNDTGAPQAFQYTYIYIYILGPPKCLLLYVAVKCTVRVWLREFGRSKRAKAEIEGGGGGGVKREGFRPYSRDRRKGA